MSHRLGSHQSERFEPHAREYQHPGSAIKRVQTLSTLSDNNISARRCFSIRQMSFIARQAKGELAELRGFQQSVDPFLRRKAARERHVTPGRRVRGALGYIY